MVDQNYIIPIGIKDNTNAGITSIARGLGGLRADISKPLRTAFEVDTSALDAAEKRAAQTRQKMLGGAGQGVTVARSSLAEIPLRPQITKGIMSDEQRIKDLMEGIVAGMEQRAEVQEQIRKQEQLELEARRRLGLSLTNYVDVAAKDMKLGDLEGPAERRPLREAHERSEARDRDLRATQLRMSRDSRLLEDTGSYGDGFKGATPDSVKKRLELVNGKIGGEGGLYGAVKGATSAFQKTTEMLGRLVILQKVAEAAERLPQAINDFENNSKYYSRSEAIGIGLSNTVPIAGSLAKGIRAGQDWVLNKYSAPDIAEKNRLDRNDTRNELADMLAARQEKDARFLSPVMADLTGRATADRRAAELAGIRDPNRTQQKELEYTFADGKSALDDRLRQGREAQLSRHAMESLEQGVAESRKQLDAKFGAERARLLEDEDRKNAAVERQAILDHSERQYTLQQELYEAQGQTVSAALEQINHQSDVAIAEAKERVKQLQDQGFLDASPEVRAARQAQVDAEAAKGTRQRILVPEALRRADLTNGQTLAEGLQQQGALGDVNAAIRSSKLILEQQNAERRRTLENIVKEQTTTKEQADEAKRQLGNLKSLGDRQAQLAEAQLRNQEDQRRAGVFADVNSGRIDELRRQADRTGNGGLGLQADAYELAEQFNQRRLALQGQLTQNGLQADEQKALREELAALPDRLRDAVGDITRAKVTSADFAAGALAQAQDAGGLTGLAQNARENVQARIAKLNEDMAGSLKALVEMTKASFKSGNAAAIPLRIRF